MSKFLHLTSPYNHPLPLILLLLMHNTPPTTALLPIAPPTPLLSFLQRLQSAALQTLGPVSFDPKLYVDLPLKHDLSHTASAFDDLPRTGPGGSIARSVLEAFLASHFDAAGDDLVGVDPPDFVDVPEGFLPRVESREARAWALEVHVLWRELSRKVSAGVRERPERHTLLPLPERFVVPGERFREVYYWDSYWNVRGLLTSKMYDSAKAVVNNLLSLLDIYGHVPNGARTYYTNRSQPPLLSSMVMEIYHRTGDLKFVERALPSLLKEHGFWNSGVHRLVIQDTQGRNHSLSRYFAVWNKPRPESATIDEDTASRIQNDSDKKMLYRELASTAESGWDFSSRWMSDPSGRDLTTLSTTSILPVDLNAYALKMELDISSLASVVGDVVTSDKFKEASKLRHDAMESVFWNAELSQWCDYWAQDDGTHIWDAHNQNRKIFASNFIPIWIETFNSDNARVEEVMTSLKSSGLLCNAGIATSLLKTGEQWDFPNGWAPLQHMIVEGLARSGLKEARSLAEDIAMRWIRTNYVAYKKTGAMHEKYDIQVCGDAGVGGEYKPQTGFGWSNGVVLAFLEEFGWPKDRQLNCVS